MARLRREHHRLLGNGYCIRPAELDCAFESICENCAFFQTSIEFRPTLQAQHDHAAAHGQTHRALCDVVAGQGCGRDWAARRRAGGRARVGRVSARLPAGTGAGTVGLEAPVRDGTTSSASAL
jgi:hypothetical protein